MNQPHSAKELLDLADALERQQIQYVFAFTSYLKPDGRFNAAYSHAPLFVQTLRAQQPSLNVQAWIGLPLTYVDLQEPAVREQIAQFCAFLIEEAEFDGIHLDPEPVQRGDRDLLALLDEVRSALGPHVTLSIASRRIWPLFPGINWPLVGKVAWSENDYREIARRVDQIAVMTYDSALPLAVLYRHWSLFQTIQVSQALENTRTDLFFGVPTSEEKTWTHWPGAENMASGLLGIIDGMNDAQARPAAVTGVAIYPYWETDDAEWSTYQRLWLGQ